MGITKPKRNIFKLRGFQWKTEAGAFISQKNQWNLRGYDWIKPEM